MSNEDFQSKVLSALNSIANGQEAMGSRLSGVESRLTAIESRLERIEDRLRKIELFVPAENADFLTVPKAKA
jgi:hypothetical protein